MRLVHLRHTDSGTAEEQEEGMSFRPTCRCGEGDWGARQGGALGAEGSAHLPMLSGSLLRWLQLREIHCSPTAQPSSSGSSASRLLCRDLRTSTVRQRPNLPSAKV